MTNQLRFIVKRTIASIITFFVMATILFFLFRLIPGDVVDIYLNPSMSPETREGIRESLGLTQPWYVQYMKYMMNVATGDLGVSYVKQQPVWDVLDQKILNTLILVLSGILLAYTIGPIIGAFLAWHRGELIDSIGIGTVLVMYAAPVFWTGMVAIMLFSFQLGWLPSGGMHSSGYVAESFVDHYLSMDLLYHLILPLTIGMLYWLSAPTFFMRSNMFDVLNSDFIEMNKAQGLPKIRILYKHAARNALLPVLHYGATAIGFAFGGSLFLEVVFSWPGVGQEMFTAVQQRDYPTAQGAFLVMSAAIIIMNFLVDIVSVYVDPRAAEEGA